MDVGVFGLFAVFIVRGGERGERGGAKGDYFADDEFAGGFEGVAFEAEAEAAGAGGGDAGLVDAGVRGVELADKEVDIAAELGAGAGAGDVGLPLGAEGGPVCAVEVGEEKAVVEGVPGLVEDDLLFAVEVDIDRGEEREGLGDAGVERDGADTGAGVGCAGGRAAAAFEEEDFFGVWGEGDGGFAGGGAGELARGGRLAGQLVEGVGVDVFLAGGFSEEREGFAVGRDDGEAEREVAEREERKALADAFEDDAGRFDGLFGGGFGRVGTHPNRR